MIERFIEPISNILDKFIADKDLKERLRFELDAEMHRIAAMQLEVNKQEASHNLCLLQDGDLLLDGLVVLHFVITSY